MAPLTSQINLLNSDKWMDYELLDSGEGQKMERFGRHIFVRPEVQAIWKKRLPPESWQAAHAIFQPSGEESGGHWQFTAQVPDRWVMNYGRLKILGSNHPRSSPGCFSRGCRPLGLDE